MGRGCCKSLEFCNGPRMVRGAITMNSLFALATIILGIVVLQRGVLRRVELHHRCRKEGTLTRAIDDAHKDAVKLYNDCQKDRQNTPLHMCPGFRKKFPDPSPYIDYLARMEYVD